MSRRHLAWGAWLALCAACGSPGGLRDQTGPVTPRAGAVVVQGCAVSDAQRATLATAEARSVLQDVVLLCLGAQASGAVTPSDAAGQAALAAQVAALRGLGYRVRLGLTLVDASGNPMDPATAAAALGSTSWRQTAAGQVAQLPVAADGWELALPPLPNSARLPVTLFAFALASQPNRPPLAIWTPPSTKSPSDVTGGDAYDTASLAAASDRLRLMTLDYSCCGAPPGPTTDTGWATDVATFATTQGAGALDVALPLYGDDLGPAGPTPIAYSDAVDLAQSSHASIAAEPTGVEHFTYSDGTSDHQVWFDTAASLRRARAAWTADVLEPSIGVLYYGLGAEDPATWSTLAGGAP